MLRKNKSDKDSARINLIFSLFCLGCLMFVVRLFQVQVLDHKKYKAMAEEQYWNLQELPAKRGNIYSRDNYILATTQTHYLLYVEPKMVKNKDEVVNKLSQKLTDFVFEKEVRESSEAAEALDQDEIRVSYEKKLKEILSSDLYWAIIEHDLTPPQKEAIDTLSLTGVGFEDEPVRYYPEFDLASHVLGFMASDEKGNKIGYYGIEGKLNDDLKGKPGKIVEEKDATGAPILVGGYKRVPPINGRDIYLTIDRSVQYIIEKALKDGVEKYDAASGTVIVMDPATSEVLAMANYPTYNYNNMFDEEPETTMTPHRKAIERRNAAVQDTYEPGSVIKPFTIAAAIDKNLVTPTTTFEDNGPVVYSGHTIDNWDGKHHSTQTIIQLLQKSNNIGAAWVGTKVGSDNLSEYFQKFGMGSKTNIELEGEDTGILRDPDNWTDIDLANISFGQGFSATPLQVLNGFNVFANGGILHKPKIIDQIVDESTGKRTIIPTQEVGRVISKESADTMVKLLTEAVSGGESKFYNLKNYKIAGKTGTAQIFVDGKYDPKKVNATFVGFLPTTRKYSMIVKLERPQASAWSSETAVPLWMDITSELVRYFGIAPDNNPDTN